MDATLGQRVLLAALEDRRVGSWSAWLEEMRRLVAAAGGRVEATVVQGRSRPDPALLFGPGKVEEIARQAREHRAELVVIACDLTPSQARNLAERIGLPVVDRTELILDIFASRARSREGKLQVELAQLSYRLPRLRQAAGALSRLGGGIGTRGPGETKLETDRRRIEARMARLRRELELVRARRARLAQGRQGVLKGVLVGYTNAGKSSLLEALARHYRGAEDRLFATLDPAARRVELLGNVPLVLTDTVGFVRDLPPPLLQAFHATLAEVQEADFLLHVVDASSPERDEQVQAVEAVLRELGAADRPTVLVYNKADLLPDTSILDLPPKALLVSARTGAGLEGLRQPLLAALAGKVDTVVVRTPLAEPAARAWLRRHGECLAERAADDAVEMICRLAAADVGRLRRRFPGLPVVHLTAQQERERTWEATR